MSSPSIRHGRPGFIATFALTLLAATLVPLAQSQQPAATTAPPFPLATGTTFVIAVSNELGSTSASNPTVAQGDYDVVVTVAGFGKDGISQSAFIDANDNAGVRRQVTVPRKVRATDLATSHKQVLGFSTADPLVIAGTTSLGPSTAVVQELLQTGHSDYSFQNFASQVVISGRLARDGPTAVKFPILLNGIRVEVSAIRTTGQVSAGSTTRRFEHVILDYPQHPFSLRMAYGPRGGGFPFKPDFAREIVRIDFPLPKGSPLDDGLSTNCRAAAPGIYFDFDAATLKPPSKPALDGIAALLHKQGSWQLRIEGHTDNVGGDRYNDDLSARRAAAVKAALETGYGIDPSRLTSRGFGARQPIETNSTIAGRARNRRVELARDCDAKSH